MRGPGDQLYGIGQQWSAHQDPREGDTYEKVQKNLSNSHLRILFSIGLHAQEVERVVVAIITLLVGAVSRRVQLIC